ncbi:MULTISPECIES: hypothetical protein [unclassified Xanthobacter]|uniref:hypothetical protein n=1 Tax=unclassified Xanthobacter TaxID=2623496 RepID=UPI001EDFC60E|nr:MULTISPECIES: hypothetical protein [unclassified Xanthobacter]
MRQLLTLFGGFAGLAVAALVGFALFTVVGGLIIVAGVVITALLLGGGLYALITGRGNVSMRRANFGGVQVFDLRTGQEVRPSMESEMIDVTPPRRPKGK